MQEATCNQCGASTILSAKFCRQCGNRLDPSEMTTRSLDAPPNAPPAYDHPTRPANSAITAPTYAPPSAMVPPSPPAPVIGNAPPSNNKMALLVFLALGLTVLIALGVVAFVILERNSGGPARVPPQPPPVGETAPPPPNPSVGIPPGVPAPPMPPPPPGTRSVTFPFDASLMYPGAQTFMSVNSGKEKVAQLRTADPLDKVADWYKDKLKAAEEVNLPGTLILSGKDLKVILNGNGEGTMITLTNDKD